MKIEFIIVIQNNIKFFKGLQKLIFMADQTCASRGGKSFLKERFRKEIEKEATRNVGVVNSNYILTLVKTLHGNNPKTIDNFIQEAHHFLTQEESLGGMGYKHVFWPGAVGTEEYHSPNFGYTFKRE